MKWNNASKVALAGVLALGVTVAVSTYAAPPKKGQPKKAQVQQQKKQANQKNTSANSGIEVLTMINKEDGGKKKDQPLPRASFGIHCFNQETGVHTQGSWSTNNDGRVNFKTQKGGVCKISLSNGTLNNRYLLPNYPQTQYACSKANFTSRTTFILAELAPGAKAPKESGNGKVESKQNVPCSNEYKKLEADQKKNPGKYKKGSHNSDGGGTIILD